MIPNQQIVTPQIESRMLADNPLGDPATREMPVYLPPGYADSQQRYSVIIALAAFMSWGHRLFNLQAWDENLAQRADRLIRAGNMPPVIIAFPDCFTRYGGSQYVNSSAIGRYEDYVVQEIVPFIDREFRTTRQNAVMGHSSGGYGALWLAMRHSDIFTACAAHSADMAFEHSYWQEIGPAVRCLSSSGGIDGFLNSFNQPYKSKDWYSALNLVAMSACYSPNPDSPLGFDLLCDPFTGAIREAVWQRWQQFDPVRVAPQHLDALRTLKALYFDCGSRDEYNLFLGARMLHRLLDEHQVAHQYVEYEGGHSGANWRFETSLPLLASALTSAG